MANVPESRRAMQQWCIKNDPMPKGAIVANLDKQAENNSYGVLAYYVDKSITCRSCGKKEVWTARRQQWWYEVAHGNINSQAIHCRSCRQRLRAAKTAQKAHMEEMAKRKKS